MLLQSSDTVTLCLALIAKLKLLGLSNIVWILLSLLIYNVFNLILDFDNNYSVLDACCQ